MTNVELILHFNEVFNQHDVDAMMAMMSEDCVFENTFPPPDGERFSGQEKVRAFWERFFQESPNARIDVEDLFVCAERAAQNWVYTWVDAQGQQGHIRGVDVFHLREGMITVKLSYVKG